MELSNLTKNEIVLRPKHGVPPPFSAKGDNFKGIKMYYPFPLPFAEIYASTEQGRQICYRVKVIM